jgi:hypothetical protein
MITPLTPPVFTLFDRLSTLNGLLLLLSNQLDNFKNLWRRVFKEQGFDIEHSIAGFTLGISDLTASPALRVRGWYPVGSLIARGEQYLDASDSLLSRENAWTVSQAFEAFETFLKDLCAHLLVSHPECVHIIGARIPDRGQFDLLRMKDAVRRLRWSTLDFTKAFGRISPLLVQSEVNNNRDISIPDWHSAFAEVRHAATHANFIIRSARMSRLGPGAKSMLPKMFAGAESDEGYVLSVTVDQAKSALERTGEYAFLIFKCLSIEVGSEWDILTPREDRGA